MQKAALCKDRRLMSTTKKKAAIQRQTNDTQAFQEQHTGFTQWCHQNNILRSSNCEREQYNDTSLPDSRTSTENVKTKVKVH